MRLLASLLLTAFLAVAFVSPASPDEPIDTEVATRVKAAYLFQFTRFVRWPDGSFPDEESPIVIGVLGEDPFGPTLDSTVGDERVRGRKIEVHRLGAGAPAPEAVRGCHVLFVSASLAPALDTMLETWRDTSVLTVSDVDGFAARGGVVELAPEQGRIIFKINLEAAERAGLKLSARLLRLAEIVEPGADG